MKRHLTLNSTSNIVPIQIDDSSSTTGAGLTALVFNSAGLTARYKRSDQSGWTTITLVSGTIGTFISSGFIELGRGAYELGLPNAALTAGTWVIVQLYGATNMADVRLEIEIDRADLQDAVRMGLTALPNVASGSDGSVMLRGATQDTTLRSLTINNSAGDAISLVSSAFAFKAVGDTVGIYGQGLNAGIQGDGTGGPGMYATGTTYGVRAVASGGTGVGLSGEGGSGGKGIAGSAGAGSAAVGIEGSVTGAGKPWSGLWEMLTSGTAFATVGSIGKLLVDMLGGLTSIAAAVWTYATRTLTASAIQASTATSSGTAISIRRGDSISITLTGLGTLTSNTKLWFTAKRRASDADSEALVQIERTVGLVYLNGAAGTASQGSITVNDAATGSITIALDEAASDDLPAVGGGVWDVQSLIGTTILTHSTGSFAVSADVTRAVA